MLCQRGSAEGAGREHGQDTWAELAKGIFHGYKLGGAGQEALVTAWGRAGHWPEGGEQLCNASLTSLGFNSSLLFITFIFRFSFFLFLLPSEIGTGDWGSSCGILSCQLGLNHSTAWAGSWRQPWGADLYLLCQTADPSSWSSPKSCFSVLVMTQVSATARSRLQGWRASTQTLAPTEGWATCHHADVWMFGKIKVKFKFLFQKENLL